MRLFLGIDLPKELKEKIFEYLGPLQKSQKGWENPADYHLTMLFIGEEPEMILSQIKEKISQVTFDPIPLVVGGMKFFNRRVAYMEVLDNGELTKLRGKITRVFPEWVKPDERPYIPHITVKRWQRYEYEGLEAGLKSLHPMGPISFVANGLSLFESKKNHLGQKYHVIYQ